ncbi:TRAP transporter small permease [Halarsenatibacter silvermanii]|uniref:TRAP-type C4-dicarboxylate transport system, small permease component n=1 Tax=Halarsenatibacter silvermanii TaxID=321763 RepID=A0A1G9IMC2_9FIRM|nr:TRAP transporter small permease [Halarsenatibacter silvermanii]SDL26302.1 TRAP-type C4-dicarboxylate transport system, small permease component [Halarsenatibacter silvermanii]
MKTLARGFKKFTSVVVKLSQIFCALLMVAMIIIVTVGVFYRYVLGRPLPWVTEIVRFSLVWLSLIGAAVALYKNEHVAVNYFYKKAGKKLKFLFEILNVVIIGYFSYIMLVYGYEFTDTLYTGTFTGISGTVPRMAIPVSGGIMILVVIDQLINNILFGRN